MDDIKTLLNHDKLIMLVTNQHSNVSTYTLTRTTGNITKFFDLFDVISITTGKKSLLCM